MNRRWVSVVQSTFRGRAGRRAPPRLAGASAEASAPARCRRLYYCCSPPSLPLLTPAPTFLSRSLPSLKIKSSVFSMSLPLLPPCSFSWLFRAPRFLRANLERGGPRSPVRPSPPATSRRRSGGPPVARSSCRVSSLLLIELRYGAGQPARVVPPEIPPLARIKRILGPTQRAALSRSLSGPGRGRRIAGHAHTA